MSDMNKVRAEIRRRITQLTSELNRELEFAEIMRMAVAVKADNTINAPCRIDVVWADVERLAHSEIDLFDGLFKKGPQPCVGCSALTDDGAACVDDDLVYIDGPLRPVCADCHPKVSFERGHTSGMS